MHDAVRISEGLEFLKHLHTLRHQRPPCLPMNEAVRTIIQPALILTNLYEVFFPRPYQLLTLLRLSVKCTNGYRNTLPTLLTVFILYTNYGN